MRVYPTLNCQLLEQCCIFLNYNVYLVFYTAEGCLADTVLTSGDPNVDCTKKATSGVDFQLMALEHSGQPEAEALYLRDLGYVYAHSENGYLDYVPIETTDDCEAEGDEVFGVYSRTERRDVLDNPPSLYGTSDPEAGFEVVIADNDGKYG